MVCILYVCFIELCREEFVVLGIWCEIYLIWWFIGRVFEKWLNFYLLIVEVKFNLFILLCLNDDSFFIFIVFNIVLIVVLFKYNVEVNVEKFCDDGINL